MGRQRSPGAGQAHGIYGQLRLLQAVGQPPHLTLNHIVARHPHVLTGTEPYQLTFGPTVVTNPVITGFLTRQLTFGTPDFAEKRSWQLLHTSSRSPARAGQTW